MKQAFIAVDVQNGWADDNPATTEAIGAAVIGLRREMPVIWVYMGWLPTQEPFQARELHLKREFNAVTAPEKQSRWNQPALLMEPEDWIITKPRLSLFSNPFSEPFLRQLRVNEIFMGGFKTADCVYASARDACRHHGFKTTVLSGLTADEGDATECEGKEFFHRDNVEFRRLSLCNIPAGLGFPRP
ncbi:MAG: isochorismatase family protein [Micavibrio aeruginosavorus]|nr:isochorismatase family protein [Micavibrio aeruginosavorus]